MLTKDFRFSQIISILFHPFIIPTLAIAALILKPGFYFIMLPMAFKIWYIVIGFVFTVLIPATGIFILLKFKAIQSIEMYHRSERTVPLIIAGSGFVALLYLLRSINIPPIFLFIIYSATFSLMAGLIINLAYKISLHTLGWSALTAALISISLKIGMPLLSLILISILINGLVGYARLKENAHNAMLWASPACLLASSKLGC